MDVPRATLADGAKAEAPTMVAMIAINLNIFNLVFDIILLC
jgi:hypothetical protein